MSPYTIITREKNLTISCIQIGFNASKDIQEWDGHSKLEFIDTKTNISSFLLSLHRFDKTVKTNKDRQQRKIYKNETGNKTMAALLLVLEIYKKKKKSLSPTLRAKCLNLGVLHHNEESSQGSTSNIELSEQKWFKSHVRRCLKIFKRKLNGSMYDGLLSSVVDISGHKHRECIV